MNACVPTVLYSVNEEDLSGRMPLGIGDQPKFIAHWAPPSYKTRVPERFLFKSDAWRYPVGIITEQLLQGLYARCGIKVPDSFLVQMDQKLWLASRWFVGEGQVFKSGTQLLGALMGGEDRVRALELTQATRSTITLSLVKEALEMHCGSAAQPIYEDWVRMLLMDALVGNTDRSTDNWGLLHESYANGWRLAPAFDTSRALLYQQDELFLSSMVPGTKASRKWLESYCHGSLPKICIQEGQVVAHLQLANQIQKELPAEVKNWWTKLLTDEGWNVIETTAEAFHSLVSANRLHWWKKVLRYRFNALQKGLSKA